MTVKIHVNLEIMNDKINNFLLYSYYIINAKEMILKKIRAKIFNEPHYHMRTPTFMDGMASNYDLYNSGSIHYINISPMNDLLGMKSDFDQVGQDFKKAIGDFEQNR